MTKLQLKAGKDGLRVRDAAETGKPIGQIYTTDEIESLEPLKETRTKLAADNQWLKIRTGAGLEGYTAAWFLELAPGQSFPEDEPEEAPLMVKPTVKALRVRDAPETGLQVVVVGLDDTLTSLEDAKTTRAKVGVEGMWLKVRTETDLEGYTAAWFLEVAGDTTGVDDKLGTEPKGKTEPATQPKTEPEVKKDKAVIALRPTVKSLRLRDAPETGQQVAIVSSGDVLISLENAEMIEAKLGVEGKWLRVKTIYDLEAYAAAWFLERHDGPIPEPTKAPKVRSILGMNLDIDHPQGRPTIEQLHRLGWVRIKFNVSFDPRKQGDARYGNTDVDYTYSRFIDAIRQYANSGLKILLVLTHQAYGEGAGYYWPTMTTERWRNLTPKYADIARRIAAKFAGTGLVSAYQIWNEQDTRPEHARAAVPIPASDYGHLLAEAIKAIRSVDKDAFIITGGHVGGPVAGSNYALQTIAAMPSSIRPDGIAFHPYGRGVKGHKFSNFGALSEEIDYYYRVLPGKPVWITEWGVLNIQGRNELAPQVTDYAQGFLNICNKQYSGRVAAAIWYAWADGMDNGYGFVKSDGKPKSPLFDALAK